MGAKTTVFFVLAFANCVFCNLNVPVLIWNNHQSGDVNVPAVSALQQLSVASLQARYFDAFHPNNVLLFLQDALSIEDLSSHGSELSHVSKWMEAGHSLYLPNVVQPGQLQHDLVQQGYKVTSLAAHTAIAELKLDTDAKNLVIVKLPPTLTNPSRSRALRKADEVMQSVLSKIGGLAEFTVIYTGLKPSVEQSSEQHSNNAAAAVEEQQQRVRVSRSLKSISLPAIAPANFHENKCIFVYFRENMSISISGQKGPFYPIPEYTQSEPKGECNEGPSQVIHLNYKDVTLGDATYSRINIGFFFESKRSYWRSPRAQVTLYKDAKDAQDKRELQLIKWKDLAVPIGKSYACSVPLVYREISNKTDLVELVINGVQVEAFMKTGQTKFSSAWDCVGFFSIGIWSGLFASLLAVVILAVGLACLANIKTMDRFDDPKGKTIMVPQATD